MADPQKQLDTRFMELALALGRRGLGRTWPNPAVGAVIVAPSPEGPRIVGRGWTQPGGRPHAEVEALRRAGPAARGAMLYVTLEPCSHQGRSPPCADAVIAAGIRRVVSALEDPNPLVAGKGHERLRAAGIAVSAGIGAAAALRDHAGHVRRMHDGRPHVLLKLAVSRDEKIALAGRRPTRITGDSAQARVHRLRSEYDAVLTGIGTVLADDPLLTCRLPGMAARSPVRIVLDPRLRLPVTSRLVMSAKSTPLWVVCAGHAPAAAQAALQACGAEVLRLPEDGGRVDLAAALKALAELGLTRVMLEAGPMLVTAMLCTDLIDAVALFRSAAAIGADGIDALEGLPLSALTQSPRLVSLGIEAVGNDTLEWLEPNA